ncbi:MAG TPA: DUF501 domain-containing protein, partial [Geodermatophilus sp.]|nr:DUF501 domain-containing protein [Geodermatophilus sp.]
MTRVAAIDCGTNSIRLLVADVPPEGPHTDLLRRMEVVRLGQGVDATGRLSPAAVERTRKVLAEYAGQARELGATAVRMVATSATRDAANRRDFEEMVLATLGRRPDVVQTSPRLEDGTPFPTLYYLTCARLTADVGRLEADGRMRVMTERLAADPELAAGYAAAHESYLLTRDSRGVLPTRATAGGMPDRVKCLHALAAHALAAGPGVNPLGDEVLERVGPFWSTPCLPD